MADSITILNDSISIIKYFANCKPFNEILKLKVADKNMRRLVHEEAEKLGLRAHTLYVESDRRQKIRCDNCKKYTTIINGKGSENACCREGCSCTQQYVKCENCEDGEDEFGKIYWDFMDIEDKIDGKYIVKQFYAPSDQMIIRHPNTPYKHLNNQQSSYRTHGNHNPKIT